MLLVKTKVGPSTIHGVGLFADQFIEKGTILWRFTPGVDARYAPEQVSGLPPAAREYLAVYSFPSKQPGLRVLCMGNANYFNHSKAPSARSGREDGEEEVVTRALRDIVPGEEITDDYHSYDSELQEGWDR
jgi:uncharacterized protein